ncbi:IS21-like element helper ATPase IstB [Cytobacillus sp. S13-E01]|uniref:IS21-like element helper ATPase IstB n=1 Tax=Cytobacillus sp. S13-E01 TaxID=3031326 RepID=UPI0023D7E6B6|nr:IS21-like element helper ATPase IstB [Cytobacillus sp. S13-E01]MDF0728727.1 IS21-like element helper ATPase IstB [Cytobacillus sp. S13-E01]MDF0728883.1 IS21-like element helper ATPase IstB [Cytobacillus sp. S13-E01]MDF0728934.1 IS21-like element helper ATPase IstB [Cytobacillus sp. S13-E01]MDF0729004.1 IS21-like element helper ATPase IstB [Cytobacillus sp. S13-E01]MDF0729052.1 IS21-like element helper ATPase IstB [Cytobacillus sp. S13-E01]
MNHSIEQLQHRLRSLRWAESATYLPQLISKAETEDWTYRMFIDHLTAYEQKRRDEKQIEKRLKWAGFPFYKTLEAFNLNEQQSLSKKQINQLKEFAWLDQLYNLILLGPTGVGKTLLSTALGIEAIHQGYKVSFISMGELIHTLKTEEFTRKSQTRMKRIRDSHLIIIDDLMYMAMDTREANLFFHLINDLYDKSSVIITSNKGPQEWGELLGDPGITTAILDRLIHRAEVIHFREEKSYRMKHRSSIFGNESVQN